MSPGQAFAVPLPGLLRLAPGIRERIYRYVGLAQWSGSSSLYDLHGRKFPDAVSPDCWRGLLLCCRPISAEAVALLYSANRFIIFYSGPGSLEPLRALSPLSIACLTNLKIVLNQIPCLEHRVAGGCCLDYYINARLHQRFHERPLPGSASSGKDDNDGNLARARLEEWDSVASHLSPNVKPGRLDLALICDIDNEHQQALRIAGKAVTPLLSLPVPKACHIRLGRHADPGLRQVAEDAVRQVTGTTTPYLKPKPSYTGLVTLPRELRLLILEYTDLIAPWREVTWCGRPGKYWVPCFCCTLRTGARECDNAELYHGCQFFRCETAPPSSQFPGSFCRRRHAAFSPTCNCWAPPGPGLFLICRALCRDAQLVFFSGNRFILHHKLDRVFTEPWRTCNRLVASVFVRDVVPTHCLRYLRFLDLAFCDDGVSAWPQPGHPSMQDWDETVKWLRDKVNGPGLTLRLNMGQLTSLARSRRHSTFEAADADVIVAYYGCVLNPLRQLTAGENGLARFHARFGWPLVVGEEDFFQNEEQRDMISRAEQRLKANAERLVMGDRYDSLYARGYEEPRPSMWLGMRLPPFT